MADIDLTEIDSNSVTSADTVMENFYGHNFSKSLSQLNGGLQDANRDPGWAITGDHVRQNALVNGSMVGVTGNLDFTKLASAVTDTDEDTYRDLPGCGLEFYLPYTASVLMITWQVIGARTALYGHSSKVQLYLRFDGTIQTDQFIPIPDSAYHDAGTSLDFRILSRDRVWAGHDMQKTVAAGWHSANIAIFCDDDMARFRVRNMKAIWFK